MDALDGYIAQNKTRFLAELRELCAIPCEARDRDALRRASRWCRDRLAAAGAVAREVVVDDLPPLVAGETGWGPYPTALRARGPLPPGKRTLLCVQHYDVQPAVPIELWKTPPYEPTVRDGAIYARGVSDNKGHLLLRIQALEAHRAVFGELPIKVRFLIEGEEESGSSNLAALIEQAPELLDADGALKEGGAVDAKGHPHLVLGNKGILYVELRHRSMARDAHSGGATHLPNAAWRLVAALRTLVDDDGRVLVKGFYDRVRSQTAEERELVRRMPFEAAELKRIYALGGFAWGRDDKEAKQASVFQPTCNICGIWSGYIEPGTKTVIPSEAAAKLDFRLVPDQDPQEIARLLRAHLDARGFSDVEVRPIEGEMPYRGPADDPLVRAAKAVAEEAFGTEGFVVPGAGGTAPMWLVSHRRRIANVTLGMGHPDSRAHAPNENVILDLYWRALKATALLYSRYATQA